MTQMTIFRPAVLSILVAGLLLLTAGCANTYDPTAATGSEPTGTGDSHRTAGAKPTRRQGSSQPADKRRVEVVRSSRYQLVKLSPRAGQRNLLKQTISMDLPNGISMSVVDGLEHVLADSGLRLCDRARRDGRFDTPLPAVDRNLGPTTLDNALQVLAGPAWALNTNFATRTVCFDRRGESKPSPDSSKGSDGGPAGARHD